MNGKIINFMEKVNFILKMVRIIKVAFAKEKQQERVDIFIIMVAFMKVELKIMKLQALGVIMTLFKDMYMKGYGLKMCLQDKVNKNSPMDLIIKANLKTELKMEKGDIYRIQESMKEILKMANLMDEDHLLMLTIENMSDNGKMESFKERVYSLGLMEISIKVSM